MNKYVPLLCIPLLPLLGCSTTPDSARKRTDNAAGQRLEKRIDDLSNTISLLANDGNQLHNDLAEVKALTKDIQLKTDGLVTSIRDLEERMDGVVASLNDKNTTTSPQPESNTTPDQTPLANFNKLLEKVISDVQQVVSSEKKSVADEQVTSPSLEDTPAVETQSAGTDKKEDSQKEAVRLVVEDTPKATEENKAVEAPVVKQELAAKVQEVAKVSEEVAQTETKVTVTSPVGTPTTAVKPVAEDAPKAPEEKKAVEAPVVKQEVAATNQEAVVAVAKSTSAVESIQKGSETAKQTSEPKVDAAPQKQDATVANLLSDPRTREPYLKEAIGRLAEKVFPDNKGIRWNIISFDHKAHLTHTEAEPLQVDLGCPRFKFVVSFKTPENPIIVGTYSFSGGQYTPYFPKKK